MFFGEVKDLDIISPEAEAGFPNIKADKYGGDASLLATMRCVLPDRIPEGETVTAIIRTVSPRSDNARDNVKNAVSGLFLDGHGYFAICSVAGVTEQNEKFLESLDNEDILKEFFPGYTKVPQVDHVLAKFNVFTRVLVNRELKSSVVFISNMELRRLHMIQSLLPRYFPWYFEGGSFTDEEQELFRSLTKKDIGPYIDAVKKFEDRYDFRTMRIRGMLSGFEQITDKQTLSAVERELESTRAIIDRELNKISECYTKIEDLTTRRTGLIAKLRSKSEEDGELVLYAIRNKALELVNVDGSEITFIAKTYLDNFDPEVFDRYFDNEDGYFFYDDDNEGYYRGMDYDDWRMFLKAAFQDEVFKIRTCACYRVNFASGAFCGESGYTFPSSCSTYIPNQHIQRYHCLGGNEETISRAMLNHDFVAVIEACVASAKNINFTDSAVVPHFFRALCASKYKCVELPDGTVVSPKEAVEWLKKKED